MDAVVKAAAGPGHVELRDMPEPVVPPGWALVEVHVAGVCGTDLHIWRGEYPSSPPVILGHEMAGTVVQINDGGAGSGATSPARVGDVVTAIPYSVYCGVCDNCRAGRPNRCVRRRSFGSGLNGAFTRYLTLPATNLFRVPEGVSPETAAFTEPLACALRAVADEGHVGPGDAAVVSGPGPIGLWCAALCSLAGARVILLGRAADERRLDLAAGFPNCERVVVDREEPVEAILSRTGGAGADVVLECAGVGPSAATCLGAVRRGGRYVQVGLFAGPVPWDLGQVAIKELRVSGPFGALYDTFPRALSLLARHGAMLRAVVTDVRPLRGWQSAFEDAVAGREAKVLLRP